MNQTLFPSLQKFVEQRILQFESIHENRKALLAQLIQYIQDKISKGERVQLNFICTHNSRRSHISQLWAQAAGYYYGIDSVTCYSGGTEATAFNPRAVKAMQEVGFKIVKLTESDNPTYEVSFAANAPVLKAYSKVYDAPENPSKHFSAIMTCSHADENCPYIPGVESRIALTYDDPKEFDNTPEEATQYGERVQQIATELLYAFSKIKN
jgi:arsenate reductase (thioredoxin)